MNENPRHRLSIAVVFVWDFIHKSWQVCRTACPVAEIQVVFRVNSAPSQFPVPRSLVVGCPETKLLESTMSNESDHNMICLCFATVLSLSVLRVVCSLFVLSMYSVN
jgi:hypothetical protein